METEGTVHPVKIWGEGTRRCVLVGVGEQLELCLYDKRDLIGLALCETGAEAIDLALVWQEHPPTWPPF